MARLAGLSDDQSADHPQPTLGELVTFPAAEQRQAFASWLHLTGISSSIGSVRPDLIDAVRIQEERSPCLTIDLPLSGKDQTKIGVAQGVMGSIPQWMVAAPGNRVVSTFWILGTSPEVLAQAALQSWDCQVADRPLPSPWTWSESERSEAARLADHLAAEGLTVTAVAATNPVVTRQSADGCTPGLVDLRKGELVRVTVDNTEAQLRRVPGTGWLVEAPALTPQDRASLTATVAQLTGVCP